jgi:hypothetical protein
MGASSMVYALIGDDFKGYYWNRMKETLEDEPDFETKGHKWSVHFRYKVLFEDSHSFIQSAGA